MAAAKRHLCRDPMRLVHYTDHHVVSLHSVAQRDHPGFKPRGLWLSVQADDGCGWRDWCMSEGFGLGRLTHIHDVMLAPGASMLRLASAEDIDAFTSAYLIQPGNTGFWVDWMAVAREYQGIVIAPYIWERRLARHTFWYYTWDCASACVWDADAISTITLRE